MADAVDVFFHFFQQALGFQVLDDLVPAGETVQVPVVPGLLGHAALVVDDPDGGQIVPGADVEVVEIVGRGDLEGAGAELHFHIVVGDHRDFPAQDRQQHCGRREIW